LIGGKEKKKGKARRRPCFVSRPPRGEEGRRKGKKGIQSSAAPYAHSPVLHRPEQNKKKKKKKGGREKDSRPGRSELALGFVEREEERKKKEIRSTEAQLELTRRVGEKEKKWECRAVGITPVLV